MSCDYCPHCIAEKQRLDEESLLYPRGTMLVHPEFGRVTYWRAATEFATGTHVVLDETDEDESYIVSAENLTLAVSA